MQSLLHLRPKSSAFFFLFLSTISVLFLPFFTVSSAKIVILRLCCAKILGYKMHPDFSTNLPTEDRIFLRKPCALKQRNYGILFNEEAKNC